MAWPIALMILLIALIGVLPFWPYSRGWGYLPTGIVLAILGLLALVIWTGVIVLH